MRLLGIVPLRNTTRVLEIGLDPRTTCPCQLIFLARLDGGAPNPFYRSADSQYTVVSIPLGRANLIQVGIQLFDATGGRATMNVDKTLRPLPATPASLAVPRPATAAAGHAPAHA